MGRQRLPWLHIAQFSHQNACCRRHLRACTRSSTDVLLSHATRSNQFQAEVSSLPCLMRTAAFHVYVSKVTTDCWSDGAFRVTTDCSIGEKDETPDAPCKHDVSQCPSRYEESCEVETLAAEMSHAPSKEVLPSDDVVYSDIVRNVRQVLVAEGWSSPHTSMKLLSTIGSLTPELVVDVVKSFKDATTALNFLRWAKDQDGYEPRAEAFTHIIGRFGRERDFSAAWSLLAEMKCNKLSLDYAFSIFVHRLKRARKIYGVVKAMCGMSYLNVTPSIPIYTSALQFLFEAGHGDDAKYLYKQMLQDGLVPNRKLYEVLIVGFARMGKVEDSLLLFNDMQTEGYVPHISVYMALIGSLSMDKKLDKGHELYLEMIESNGVPKVFGVQEVACALHGEDTAEMVDDFLAVVGRIPLEWRIHSHNNLLQHLLDTGKCNDAMAIFGIGEGVAGSKRKLIKGYWTLDSYRVYIVGMGKQGHLTHAIQAFQDLCYKRFKPIDDISSFLLLSLSKARMVDEALVISRHITAKREAVSVDAQHGFFEALRTTGRLGLAVKIFMVMKRKGCIDEDVNFVSLVGLENADELCLLAT